MNWYSWLFCQLQNLNRQPKVFFFCWSNAIKDTIVPQLQQVDAWMTQTLFNFEHEQCCSCLFVSGRTVVYRSHYKRPQFPPKIDFGRPNYRLQRLMLRFMLTGPAGLCWQLDRPGRTPSTCVAWQLQHWAWGCEKWNNLGLVNWHFINEYVIIPRQQSRLQSQSNCYSFLFGLAFI